MQDVIVIGAGLAGLNAARKMEGAIRSGQRAAAEVTDLLSGTAISEKEEKYSKAQVLK